MLRPDGSKNSLRAVKYAVMLAGMMQAPPAEITLINVHDNIGLRHAKFFVGKQVREEYLHELGEKGT